MPEKNPEALEFLKTRRSRPAKTLTGPVPGREELRALLTIGARCPDHGKMEPWRYIVLQGKALARLAELAAERGAALGKLPGDIEKAGNQYGSADLVVAVIAAPRPNPKVPEIEQLYSAACVCLSLLNAALAAGWGANWLSGWASHDRDFVTRGLGLEDHEQVAGLIHIGTETNPPPERPRPDMDAIISWVEE
jgi:nitroreductase